MYLVCESCVVHDHLMDCLWEHFLGDWNAELAVRDIFTESCKLIATRIPFCAD